MDEKLITIFFTALITFALTKLWDWWRESVKNKNEERKLLRKALTSLINLWQSLQTYDFTDQIGISSELMVQGFAKLGATQEQIDKVTMKEPDKNKVILAQTQTASEKLKSLDEQVNSVMEKLSEIRPLIASEIGELQSHTTLQSFESLFKQSSQDGIERSDYDFDLVGSFHNSIFQEYKERLISRIKPQILSVAEQISKKELKESEKYLERRELDRSDFLQRKNPDLEEEYAEKVMKTLLAAHFKANKPAFEQLLKEETKILEQGNTNHENK